MTNNIILTGATGFLGSHLLKHLIDKTNYNIIILKRSFSDLTRISTILDNKRVSVVNIDQNPIETAFSDRKGGVAIIHVATDYGRDGSCVKTLEANLIYPIKLLELACKYNIELFINTDSYFNKDNMSYLYLQNYSLSKKSLNLWLKFFLKKLK